MRGPSGTPRVRTEGASRQYIRVSDERETRHLPLLSGLRRNRLLLADLLGKPDEDPLRASDVTEPILILVLRQFTNQLGSVRAEPDERSVDVLHSEHDAEVAESVHRG